MNAKLNTICPIATLEYIKKQKLESTHRFRQKHEYELYEKSQELWCCECCNVIIQLQEKYRHQRSLKHLTKIGTPELYIPTHKTPQKKLNEEEKQAKALYDAKSREKQKI